MKGNLVSYFQMVSLEIESDLVMLVCVNSLSSLGSSTFGYPFPLSLSLPSGPGNFNHSPGDFQ